MSLYCDSSKQTVLFGLSKKSEALKLREPDLKGDSSKVKEEDDN